MKKKILLVLPNLQKGGAEKVMMLIFNQLPSIKYDKYLIVLNNKIKKNILYIDPNIRLINLKKKI